MNRTTVALAVVLIALRASAILEGIRSVGGYIYLTVGQDDYTRVLSEQMISQSDPLQLEVRRPPAQV